MMNVTPNPDSDRSDALQFAIDRFNAEQPITSYFPITLKGKRLLDEVGGGCAECGKQVPPEYFRGAVTTLGVDEPSLVSFDGHALCTDCNVISPIYGRIRVVDGRMRMEKVIDGQWVYAFMTHDNWLGRLRFEMEEFLYRLKSTHSK